VIVAGSGKVKVGGEEHDVKVGHFVFAGAGTTRQVSSGPDGISWIGIGCQPGGYTPRSG
jgi:mannose-6-phosphate isomerase-like protein (cupin superfamily)